jgi:chemotaxis protein MotB
MKQTFIALAFLLAVSTITSCVILSPKKYKALLARQDSLNTGLNESQLTNETVKGCRKTPHL